MTSTVARLAGARDAVHRNPSARPDEDDIALPKVGDPYLVDVLGRPFSTDA